MLIAKTNQQPKLIHLLYVPTIFCNLGCSYCYLGKQTDKQTLVDDSRRTVSTLEYALDYFSHANVLPFNVSLHGGEVTTLAVDILDKLFQLITQHYLKNLDMLSANGFKKTTPHIKTNLYNFHKYIELFRQYKVSVSGSVDLPLFLHEKYRTTKSNASSLERTLDNLRLLGAYDYNKKLSSTIFKDHFYHIADIVEDIWKIHKEYQFDMNNFNFMFGFESSLNNEKFIDRKNLQASTIDDKAQVEFYQLMKEAFTGSELEVGFRKNWFDEFTPSYCTHAVNCGEKFFLLQSDGNVYSCVRGQGVEPFYYGNIFEHTVTEILDNARHSILAVHQQQGYHKDCQSCDYLHICHSGCAYVKNEQKAAKSYTCALQKAIYKDNPQQYKVLTAEQQKLAFRDYALKVHPKLAVDQRLVDTIPLVSSDIVKLSLPNDFNHNKNALLKIIQQDDVLIQLYAENSFVFEMEDERVYLQSQILKSTRSIYHFNDEDRLIIHIKREVFNANCVEVLVNMLYLQVLRDTKVVYGDEARKKQEHLFNYQIYYRLLPSSPLFDEQWCMLDISPLLMLHQDMFIDDVINNLFITTHCLRDYHYQKQKTNGFYHIQALNLPFQNIEFYWIKE